MAALLLVAAAMLVGGAVAWACTPVTSFSVSPDHGPTGSRVTLTGGKFGPGQVTIRWVSTGQVLARPQGPDFSVIVTIPGNAPIDTHQIHARGSEGDKTVVFKVVNGSASRGPSGPERSTSQGTNANSSVAGGSGPSSSPTPQNPRPRVVDPGSGGASFPTPSQPPAPAPTSGQPTTSPGQPSAGLPPGQPASATGAVASPGRAGPVATSEGSSSGAGDPSPAMAPDDQVSSSPDAAGAAPDELAGPSPASVAGDLWSGFAPGAPTERGASLTGPAPSRTALPVEIAALLFVLGLVALFAGFGVAELRRTRVEALDEPEEDWAEQA